MEKITWRCPFTQAYHKWQSCDIWFLRYEVQPTFFALLHPYLPKKWKYQKNEKNPEHIRRVTNEIVIFHFGIIFAFLPLNISKNWRRYLEISSSYASVQKIMIRWCTVPEIWCAIDGWADGRRNGKSDIYRWMPPPKKNTWMFNQTF